MIHTQDADFTLLCGDVMNELATLPDESVHCVVTSPPYWGLRDYGTGSWVGGNPDCDHEARRTGGGEQNSTLANPGASTWVDGRKSIQFADVCGKCGARRVDQQLGLEATPEAYVARMVEVFREVRRVLRADGTCWVNLGDSYLSNVGGGSDGSTTKGGVAGHVPNAWGGGTQSPVDRPSFLKPKDLAGMPWRVAFALQADGWYLRSDIIWAKSNPMPESVTDRPTKAHEYVFLLSKGPRYFFDQEAVREPAEWAMWGAQTVPKYNGTTSQTGWMEPKSKAEREAMRATGRNVRSVWDIATQPYPEAHFATYPEELVRRCVLAGTSERGCCPECGKPWEREVEIGESDYSRLGKHNGDDFGRDDSQPGNKGQTRTARGTVPSLKAAQRTLTGWRPTCGHDATPIPCTVLDPFLGSGTTAYVARKHGRKSIGIEISPAYCELAARRMQQQSLEFYV